MTDKVFDEQAYKRWHDEKLKQYGKLVPYVQCPECEGEGSMECECCGHESDCSECDGLGDVKLTFILTRVLYQACLDYDKAKMKAFIEQEPITEKNKHKHPLTFLDELADKARKEQKN